MVDAFRASGAPVERLLVDGGPTRNDQLMQFEADMVDVPVERTPVAELSAMGVAHLAGVSAGLFTLEGLGKLDRGAERFAPRMDAAAARPRTSPWAQAVARARGHADPPRSPMNDTVAGPPRAEGPTMTIGGMTVEAESSGGGA